MFFTKDKFFRGLRIVLALDANKVALGEVVIDVIERDILPDLQTKKAREPDEGRQEELQKEIDVWKTYADRRSPQGRSWNIEAVKTIGARGNTLNIDESLKEEMAQEVAYQFYKKPNMRKKLSQATGGPKGLLKLFKKIIDNETYNAVRKWVKQQKQKDTGKREFRTRGIPLEKEEGGSIMQTLRDRSESELDRAMIREVKRDMSKYVEKRLPLEAQKSLFNRWMELAEKEGPDKVNISKDIIPDWGSETGKSSSSGDAYFKKIKGLIVDYLREEQGINLSKSQLKKLKVSHAVADKFIRQQFASWMLEFFDARRNQIAKL